MSQWMLGRTYRGGVSSLRRWGSCSEQGVCSTYRPTEAPTAPHLGRWDPHAALACSGLSPTAEKGGGLYPAPCGSSGWQEVMHGQPSGSRMSGRNSLGSPLWPGGQEHRCGQGPDPAGALWNKKGPQSWPGLDGFGRACTLDCIHHWVWPAQRVRDLDPGRSLQLEANPAGARGQGCVCWREPRGGGKGGSEHPQAGADSGAPSCPAAWDTPPALTPEALSLSPSPGSSCLLFLVQVTGPAS